MLSAERQTPAARFGPKRDSAGGGSLVAGGQNIVRPASLSGLLTVESCRIFVYTVTDL
jgi:hypothetical protein